MLLIINADLLRVTEGGGAVSGALSILTRHPTLHHFLPPPRDMIDCSSESEPLIIQIYARVSTKYSAFVSAPFF